MKEPTHRPTWARHTEFKAWCRINSHPYDSRRDRSVAELVVDSLINNRTRRQAGKLTSLRKLVAEQSELYQKYLLECSLEIVGSRLLDLSTEQDRDWLRCWHKRRARAALSKGTA